MDTVWCHGHIHGGRYPSLLMHWLCFTIISHCLLQLSYVQGVPQPTTYIVYRLLCPIRVTDTYFQNTGTFIDRLVKQLSGNHMLHNGSSLVLVFKCRLYLRLSSSKTGKLLCGQTVMSCVWVCADDWTVDNTKNTEFSDEEQHLRTSGEWGKRTIN